MKIVSWNCCDALRKKLDKADSLQADVLIIQECENPALSTEEYRKWAGNYLWMGTNKNKGIGVFPKFNNSVCQLDWNGSFAINGLNSASSSCTWSTNELQLFLPFKLNNHYNALACWTKGDTSNVFSYIGQLWKYIQIHRADLKLQNTIIAGDLNSNSIWDKIDRRWNHTDTVNELKNIGIESLYHYQTNELQGNETQPTFYLYRNEDKRYHIDYIFMSKQLLTLSKLEIGHVLDWIPVSDHLPICATINLSPKMNDQVENNNSKNIHN